MSDPFERILGQPKVREFLRATVASGLIGQSYLFTGPAGSNKTTAAYALAQAVVCEDSGCGTCDACKRVMRRRHPDVIHLEPAGVDGYLAEQVRDIVADVNMAPVQAKSKVYIIDRADQMGASAANAFLKTLEEPPAHVVLILLARTRAGVLSTIVSRCQVVPFRQIPERIAAGIVAQNSGVAADRARWALAACNGSIDAAIEFARSTDRFLFRQRVFKVMEDLAAADDLDILGYAAELIEMAKAPLDLVRRGLDEDLEASREFMARSAIRQIEARNKRALSKKTKDVLYETTALMRSWLRDMLVVCGGAANLEVNGDAAAAIRAAAAKTDEGRVVRALAAVDEADTAIRYNVSPETCIDVLLLQMREELYGSHSARGVAR
ncbi:ATP-binding protein [Curtanaerobium respiraculi]|uniref:DNA polymerase III subunit n=1 Tax=Curtanaerobium respiraculi TaxID=2949669 RepID=UPI0024B39781|nr:DNA polymerase III subunit delta' [Curtanaerobium respiraculi]